MADIKIYPSHLQGSIKIPSSKSHTLRAILFASLAKGTSQIFNHLPSPDTRAMIEAIRLLGAKVKEETQKLEITGFNGEPHVAEDVIQCGNSGQVLRFIGALSGLNSQFTILTGDFSIRHRRPLQPLLSAMTQLGAFAVSSKADGHAPLIIRGPFTHTKATLDGKDSQPVSGLLIAAAFAKQKTEIHVLNPGETPWIDLTLDWFKRLKIDYAHENYSHYFIPGFSQINSFDYSVPGDFSTAAFGAIASLITKSKVTLSNVDFTDIQGDKALFPLLKQMGAQYQIDSLRKEIYLEPQDLLQGIEIDINPLIDALPILAVLGCFGKSPMHIRNGSIARKKESDRISMIALELRKMGAQIEEKEDGLIIYPSLLHGAELESHQDHRLALSLSIAALGASSPSKISGAECIEKTYPYFYEDFRSIGAKMCI
jgi:3-phosphoshikimate 1-carboxyvinyltransferase